jgi:hypothetical protein
LSEEVLEQARVGAAEDRCRHHQNIGALDRRQFPLHCIGQLGAPDGTGELRCELTQFDQALFARDFFGDQVQQVLCQGCRPGGALQPAGHRDQAEWTCHLCFHEDGFAPRREIRPALPWPLPECKRTMGTDGIDVSQ